MRPPRQDVRLLTPELPDGESVQLALDEDETLPYSIQPVQAEDEAFATGTLAEPLIPCQLAITRFALQRSG